MLCSLGGVGMTLIGYEWWLSVEESMALLHAIFSELARAVAPCACGY